MTTCTDRSPVLPAAHVVRTTGGPLPGDRQSPGPWPLPDELSVEDVRALPVITTLADVMGLPREIAQEATAGRYVKVAESQLPEMPGIIRGAQYEWREG